MLFQKQKKKKGESVNKAGFMELVLDRSVNTQQPSYLLPKYLPIINIP